MQRALTAVQKNIESGSLTVLPRWMRRWRIQSVWQFVRDRAIESPLRLGLSSFSLVPYWRTAVATLWAHMWRSSIFPNALHRMRRASFHPRLGVRTSLGNRSCSIQRSTVSHWRVLLVSIIRTSSIPFVSTARNIHDLGFFDRLS